MALSGLTACADTNLTADPSLSRPACQPAGDLMVKADPLPVITAGDLMVATTAADSVYMLDLRRRFNALIDWVLQHCQ